MAARGRPPGGDNSVRGRSGSDKSVEPRLARTIDIDQSGTICQAFCTQARRTVLADILLTDGCAAAAAGRLNGRSLPPLESADVAARSTRPGSETPSRRDVHLQSDRRRPEDDRIRITPQHVAIRAGVGDGPSPDPGGWFLNIPVQIAA